MKVAASRPMPAVAKTMTPLARIELLNAGRANSRTSIIGLVLLRWRTTKSAAKPAPPAAEASELVRGAGFPRLGELGALATDAFGLDGLDEAFELAVGHYLDGLAAAAG